MPASIEYASFLIRLWREQSLDPADSTVDWHGQVEHIQTGQRWTFGTLDALLAFLRSAVQNPNVLRPPPGR